VKFLLMDKRSFRDWNCLQIITERLDTEAVF